MSEFSIAKVMKQYYPVLEVEEGWQYVDLNGNGKLDENKKAGELDEAALPMGEDSCWDREVFTPGTDGPNCEDLDFWMVFENNVPYIKKEILDIANKGLIEYFKDQRVGYRYMAAEVLQYTKDESFLPELKAALKDENPEVRKAAQEALGKIQGVPITQEPQDIKEAAKNAYTKGKAHFDKGNYAEALESFFEANDLFPDPANYLKIADCFAKLDNMPNAMFWLQTYITENPEAPNVADVKSKLKGLNFTIEDLLQTAQIFYGQFKWKGAVNYAAGALILDPANKDALAIKKKAVTELDNQPWFEDGKNALAEKDWAAAYKPFSKISSDSAYRKTEEFKSVVSKYIGQILSEMKNAQEAGDWDKIKEKASELQLSPEATEIQKKTALLAQKQAAAKVAGFSAFIKSVIKNKKEDAAIRIEAADVLAEVDKKSAISFLAEVFGKEKNKEIRKKIEFILYDLHDGGKQKVSPDIKNPKVRKELQKFFDEWEAGDEIEMYNPDEGEDVENDNSGGWELPK